MFNSFFPQPKLLFGSLAVWTAFCIAIWYGFWRDYGSHFAMGPVDQETKPVGLSFFITPDSIWFYLFFIVAIVLFCGFWHFYSENKWRAWSLWGTAFILFVTQFNVQVAVAINHWRRPFFDLVQTALSGPDKTTVAQFYGLILIFFEIALISLFVYVIVRFFTSHFVFRWRTAMNDYYLSEWKKLRRLEGASQRIQEDTMNFAQYVEGLGVSMVSSLMTLIAFLPILYDLSKYVKELPLVGTIPLPLVTAAILWSIAGTLWFWVFGLRLPGLEFHNQRVEAAFRKELVLGEDNHIRAEPLTMTELYGNLRRNYYRLYLNYLYFNIARSIYFNVDNVFVYILLAPSFVAAAFTLGVMNQILTAFGEVSNSFQYLVNAWTDVIKLISIYKRLRGFEAAIHDEPLAPIEVLAEPAPAGK